MGARQVSLVWAQANGGVIGRDNTIPWHVPEDMAYFKKVTQGHPVVMGRKTWDSLPAKFRPLPGRRNIVVTRQPGWMAGGAETASGLASALALANEDVCIMGGGEIYRAAMPFATRLFVTEVDVTVDGDAWAPPIDDSWYAEDTGEWLESAKNGTRYRWITYTRALPAR
ncbi:dihydrofolate reductase [Rhodococcus sp. ZPP]|uniref:dihydrofolate reductase n=1 Tax=Rhodococcus sp. ZPP TaxID=2749906 RepID=UPI001AD89CF5|nr:dihydrofolate reductase [Rhodococcus sp. ZPP]QTJ65698.1 dihydrofolate reductase [Rhodococcus sp. ZPP]